MIELSIVMILILFIATITGIIVDAVRTHQLRKKIRNDYKKSNCIDFGKKY